MLHPPTTKFMHKMLYHTVEKRSNVKLKVVVKFFLIMLRKIIKHIFIIIVCNLSDCHQGFLLITV